MSTECAEPDWKEVARQAWSRGVAFPHDEPLALIRYAIVRHPSWPTAVVASQRELRGFLWDCRKTRQQGRARGVIWKRNVGGGKVMVGLGAWTAPDLPNSFPGRFDTVETD